MTAETETVKAAPASVRMSLYDSLVGILVDPGGTFRKIARDPAWFVPCLATVLLAIVSSHFLVQGIGYRNILEQQLARSSFTSGMTLEERETVIERNLRSPLASHLYLAGPALLPLALLALTGCLTLVLMLLGLAPGFRKLFSVTLHSFWAYSLVAYSASLAVVWLSGDPASLNIRNLLLCHLGVFFDATESPVLFTLASSFDLLTFYNLGLLALGISTVGGRRASFGNSLGAVLCLWALWVGGKTVLAIFTG